jgi:hypothetical protein
MTDDELTALLKAMEDRLVGRINDGNEPVLNRLTTIETEMKNLGSKTDVAREVSFRVPRLVVEALEAGLLPRLSGIEHVLGTIDARLTAIEARLP